MAIDAGTVYYTVDADTQKAIDSAAAINKSLDTTKAKMSTLDTQVTKTSRAVNSGLGSIGRSFGQASIQMQQFIGQIQGGQDAMLALSQQGADLGFVLGAPLLGAIIGISASLAGMLLPSLFETNDATEDLEKSLKSIERVIKLNSDGVNVLSNDYAELVKKSKELAKSELLLAKVRVDQVLNQASKAAEDAFDKFDTLFNALDVSANVSVFDNLDKTLQRTDKSIIALLENTDLYGTGLTQLQSAVSKLNSEFGTTTDQSALVLRRFAEFREQKTPEAFEKLSNTLVNIADTSRGKVSPQFVELVSTISNQAFAAKNAAEQSQLLEKALNGISVETESGVKALKQWDDVAERLRVGTESLRSEQLKLEKAIALRRATEDGASQATRDSISSSYDRKIAAEQEAEAERALAKAKREKAQAEKESKEASQNFIKNFGLRGEKDVFDPNAPESIANSESREIIEGNKTLQQALEERRGMTQYYYDNAIGNAEAHAEALKILDQKIADEKQKTLDKQVKDQQTATQAQLGMYNQLFSGMQSMTSNVLASMDEQSSGYKTMFAIQKAFAVAQAIVAAELAANQILAHDVGVMGMGAVATSNMIRAMGYASAGVIAGTAIAGGRLYGGSVQAGSMYRINEDGAPEVFNAANGQQYMLPNSRGEVVSNKDATSGGSVMINVTVNADGSSSVDGDSQLKNVGAGFSQAVQMELNKSMRQGGALWQYMQSKKK
ncbi:hypothetical protein VCSRO127_0521 [Vibrio cholerae]|nr:hypothetical protein VCSRO127_0521 [Vibrio cholerae]